jgi:hypothetical protein
MADKAIEPLINLCFLTMHGAPTTALTHIAIQEALDGEAFE